MSQATSAGSRKYSKILRVAVESVRHNLRIVFADKFIYFLLAAVGFFLLVSVVGLFDKEWFPDLRDAFEILTLPGLLLIFYPSCFGIQNDMDNHTIEMVFGIPNYRYKVWLVRLLIIFLLVYFVMVMLCVLCSVVLVPVPVFEMAFHLMFPIYFLGSIAFFFSTTVRNGNGTAAIMIIIGMFFMISGDILDESRWNIFLNPYYPIESLGVSRQVWYDTIFYNRLYLLIGSAVAVLGGLLRLQSREKFI